MQVDTGSPRRGCVFGISQRPPGWGVNSRYQGPPRGIDSIVVKRVQAIARGQLVVHGDLGHGDGGFVVPRRH